MILELFQQYGSFNFPFYYGLSLLSLSLSLSPFLLARNEQKLNFQNKNVELCTFNLLPIHVKKKLKDCSLGTALVIKYCIVMHRF